jgi:hypothetical protein
MRDALARVQAAVARHPKLLMTLLLVGLLVVSADPVVAGEGTVGTEMIDQLNKTDVLSDDVVSTNGGTSEYSGPTNP